MGTSDLDVTLVGSKVMEMWESGAFYIPGLHTKPLCDKDPNIAPNLNPLREVAAEPGRTSSEYAGHFESRALWPRCLVWRALFRGGPTG